MDETSVEFMDELDHLDYPRQSVGAELDILDLDQMIAQFASQHTHPTARRPDDQAFHVRLFPKTGRGEKCTLEYGDLISYFRNNFRTLNEKTLRFFFMVQPGGWNRIWMPCMQILLSIFNVNPSFAWLVGKRHVSSFGSYVRMVDKGDDEKADKKDDKTGGEKSEKNGHNRYGEKVPRIYETWWSLSSPKFFRSGLGTLAINSLDEGQRRLFDVESYDVQSVESNRLATMMWRPSVCVQYDLERKSSTVIVLDEGPSFLDSRFKDAMLHREQLGFNEDPFAIHVLILSVVLNDWTFSFEAMQLVINEKQSRVFGNQTRRDEYEQISKSLHDLIAHQLRYQNSITAIPRVLEALRRAHHRFTELEDVPGHVFQRVEDLLERMILQAHSNRDHCMRMEQQINNIQRQLIDLTNLEMESQIRRNTQTVNDLIRRLDAEQAQRVRQAVPSTRAGPETPAVPTGGIGPALPAVETENFPAILEMVNFGREQSIILKEQAEALVQFARGAEAQSKLLKNVAITTVLFLIPTALTSTFSMEVFNFPGPGEKGGVTVSPKALILVLTASACFLGALVFAVWTMGLPVIKPYLLKPTPWAISEVERTLSWIWRGKPPGDSQNDENRTTSIEVHELQRISNNSQGSTHSDHTPPSTNTNNAPREQNRTSGSNPGASPMQLAAPPRAYLSLNASPLSPPRSQGGDSGERERAGSSGSRSSGSREVEPYVTGNGDGAAVAPAVQARLLRRNLVAEYND